jgi:hypothetical protein
MIASDLPGLAAVAASPDLLIPKGSSAGAWLEAIERVDADYARYSSVARVFADRELLPPDEIWRRFAVACDPHLPAPGASGTDGPRQAHG